ncbi:MAG: uracil-DNA glycosylase [Anaerolineae bacterium]|nr:uracil-DNA glycosylase [Anaerolineae bacterium]MDW8098933.1 uracil-DNA glycosylase [Anaerolineae bacterium]
MSVNECSIQEAWDNLNEAVISCRACPRLVAWREKVAQMKRRAYQDWDYWGRPVPGFGDLAARLLVVGLAPGAHGANRTGRMFTGDGSGVWLVRALHRAGFANQPVALHRDDGLQLDDAYITAVVRCAPPQNRPTAQEIANCRPFLQQEIGLLGQVRVVIALGHIAFDGYLAALREMGYELPRLQFRHGAHYPLPDGLPHLIASYHPSRQNTQTGRLTETMLDAVLQRARWLLDGA